MFEQKCFFELYNSNLWSKIDKQAKNKAAMPLLFVLTVSCHPLHHLGLQSHHCSSGSGQFCAKLEETMAKRGKRVDGKIAELSWVVTLSLSHTHMHTHTHTHTHKLTHTVLPSRAYFMSWANSIHMTSALTLPTLSSWGNLEVKKSGVGTRQIVVSSFSYPVCSYVCLVILC